MRLKYINDTADECVVWSRDGEPDAFFFRKFCKRFKLHDADRHIFRKRARSTVPWCHVELPYPRRLPQFPQERMFPRSAAYDQDVYHCLIIHKRKEPPGEARVFRLICSSLRLKSRARL